MSHYFANHPRTLYQVGGKTLDVTNPLVRFKLRDILSNRAALYYTYTAEEGTRADIIADKYYGDSTLDWIVWLCNDILDPDYDWPMSSDVLNEYVKEKYGSLETASSTVHHYEWIVREQSVNYDGAVVPELVLNVDETTYGTLAATEKRSVSCYEYELAQNERRRELKILHKDYVGRFVAEVEAALA